MRQSAELENQMTSVERVLEFTHIDHESALESVSGIYSIRLAFELNFSKKTAKEKPPLNWPSRGKIEFRNIIMYYIITEPPVLKNLSFIIEPQEKVLQFLFYLMNLNIFQKNSMVFKICLLNHG